MADCLAPVGFFDSGAGGISVLRQALALLPYENFVFYGDTANAPYGTKPPGDVLKYVCAAMDELMSYGVKAIVLACNTATSVAADYLRQTLTIPVIGMEPALKPAAALRQGGRILVLATPVTLNLPKFQILMEQYGEGSVPVPCPGLMEFVERGDISGVQVRSYLTQLVKPYLNEPVDAVVMGCTHYVFLKPLIQGLFPNAHVLDGNEGTVHQLARRLENENLLNPGPVPGKISLITSADPEEALPVMERLMYL